MLRRVTLDHNALIDLGGTTEVAAPIKQLVAANGKTVHLQVVGIGASEKLPGGGRRSIFSQFLGLLRVLGLEDCDILKPMLYLDVCYCDWAILGDDSFVDQERQIHEILFPNVPFLYGDFCTANNVPVASAPPDSRWLNAKCDVQSMWCHIHSGGDIFVTRDGNFHKSSKKPALEALGAGLIATPDAALRELCLLGAGSQAVALVGGRSNIGVVCCAARGRRK